MARAARARRKSSTRSAPAARHGVHRERGDDRMRRPRHRLLAEVVRDVRNHDQGERQPAHRRRLSGRRPRTSPRRGNGAEPHRRTLPSPRDSASRALRLVSSDLRRPNASRTDRDRTANSSGRLFLVHTAPHHYRPPGRVAWLLGRRWRWRSDCSCKGCAGRASRTKDGTRRSRRPCSRAAAGSCRASTGRSTSTSRRSPFWLIAGSLRLFGHSELAGRALPHALALGATTACVAWLGTMLWGARTGRWAGLAYASLARPVRRARRSSPPTDCSPAPRPPPPRCSGRRAATATAFAGAPRRRRRGRRSDSDQGRRDARSRRRSSSASASRGAASDGSRPLDRGWPSRPRSRSASPGTSGRRATCRARPPTSSRTRSPAGSPTRDTTGTRSGRRSSRLPAGAVRRSAPLDRSAGSRVRAS